MNEPNEQTAPPCAVPSALAQRDYALSPTAITVTRCSGDGSTTTITLKHPDPAMAAGLLKDFLRGGSAAVDATDGEPGPVEPLPPSGRVVRPAPRLPMGDVDEFIAARCELAHQHWTPSVELLEAYRIWASENRREATGTFGFIDILLARGFRRSRSRRIAGKQLRTWEGLRVRGGVLQVAS